MQPKCAAYVITFCTFSKQVGGRTGQLTILNTLTIAGGCSANNPQDLLWKIECLLIT